MLVSLLPLPSLDQVSARVREFEQIGWVHGRPNWLDARLAEWAWCAEWEWVRCAVSQIGRLCGDQMGWVCGGPNGPDARQAEGLGAPQAKCDRCLEG